MKKKKFLTLIIIILISFQTLFQSVVYADYDESLVKHEEIRLTGNEEFYEFVKINDIENNKSAAIKYTNNNANRKGYVVCVNAGHGTKGGEADSNRTQCHPDGTPKVTGGTTGEGSTTAYGVSTGMDFLDGTPEATVTLQEALLLKQVLLENGYDVLMIRDEVEGDQGGKDVQLDNIARSILANNYADCHIALHWDSTDYDKGAYYMSVPDVGGYRDMYPVSEIWEYHNQLGSSLTDGLSNKGVKIWGDGPIAQDLTQTSYSTVPSIDIELGDRKSDHSQETLQTIAEGLCVGINKFFNQNPDLVNASKNKSNSNKKSKDKKGILDKLFAGFAKIVSEIIDFFKFLLGDVPQMLVQLIVTIPDGTWRDFKVTYNYSNLLADGTTGNNNKYTCVSEGSKDSTYSANINGTEEEFSRDTEIPVIKVDLYHFAAGNIQKLDMDIFSYNGGVLSFIVVIIHIIIYLASAFLIVLLIWHGINIVKSSITPKEKVEHKEGLSKFIKASAMLVGSIIVMALCIFLSKSLFKELNLNNQDELPIRVNVQGGANYSFSTTILGYLRYKSDLNNIDMLAQKFLYTGSYILLAISNCVVLVFMVIRFLMLMYLSVIGPIVASQTALNDKELIKMSFKDWVIRYVIWSLIILIIAIPYKIILEMSFKN